MKNLFFITLLVSSLSYAGAGVDGGGGKSVVCRDDSGQIVSAEVLDIYEGRVQYGLSLPATNDTIKVQMEDAINNIASGRSQMFKESVLQMANFVNLRKRILPNGTALQDINDSHHVVVPKDCKVEQLANFTKQNQILIDGEIWNKLNNTNKAALIVHEALYKWFRNYGATDSIRARKFVAYGFMGTKAVDIEEGIPVDALECHTLPNLNGSPYPGSKFWAFNNVDGELVFQFDYLEGGLILTKSSVMIDAIAANEMDSVEDVTYWLNLDSDYEELTGVTISFEQKYVDGKYQSVKKIGLGNMPDMPKQQFFCGSK